MTVQVVLIGPMGAGKSSVGRLVAASLGTGFVDTDDLIEAEASKSITDIFVEDGEQQFRRLERAAVAQALREHDGVLSLGGGAVLDRFTQADLKESAAFVVFLDVTWRHVAPRVGFNTARPLLLDSPRKTWINLMEQRRPLYEDLADLTLLTDDLSPEQLSEAIVTALEHHG